MALTPLFPGSTTPATPIPAVLGQQEIFYVGSNATPASGSDTNAPAFRQADAPNQNNAGTLVLHAADPGNAAAQNGGTVGIGRTQNTMFYTAGGTLTNGDNPVYNISIFDIPNWDGLRGTQPTAAEGNNNDVVWFQNNYYRKEGGAWVNRGGFPNDIFNAYFSTITFEILNTAPQPPLAFDNTELVFRDTPKSITLVATDPDGTVVAWSVTSPTNGTLSGTAPDITYTPNAGYLGADSFEFFVNDNDGQQSNRATVDINVVNQPTDAPITQDINRRTNPSVPISITLIGSDGDGTIVSWDINQGTLTGTLTGTAPDLVYTPPAGMQSGVERFTYTVTDDDAAVSNTSTVVIRILPLSGCRDGNFVMSKTNMIVGSTLSSDIPSDTDINWLQNSDTAELTRFTDFSDDTIRITATFAHQAQINYVAIAGSNLREDAEVKFRLFENPDDAAAIFQTPFYQVGRDVVKNNNTLLQALDTPEPIPAWRLDVEIRHKYPAATDAGVTLVSDGIPRQEANGTLSMEAESCVFEDNGRQLWERVTDNSASGGQYVTLTASSSFRYSSFTAGPKMLFDFRPTVNGNNNIWLRMRATNVDGNRIYTEISGSSSGPVLFFDPNLPNNGWVWRVAQVANLTAGALTRLSIAPSRPSVQVDKVVILPAGTSTPSGNGPAVSPDGQSVVAADGTTSAGESVDIRMLLAGELLQLDHNMAYGTKLRLMSEANTRFTTTGRAVRVGDQYLSRRMSLSLPRMSDIDRCRLSECECEFKGAPFIISAYPGANRDEWMKAQHTMLTMFETANEYTHWAEDRHNTGEIVLPEV